MKITHEIREYIIEDGDARYSVKYNIKVDYWGIWIIKDDPDSDRNSVEWFEVPTELELRIKETVLANL